MCQSEEEFGLKLYIINLFMKVGVKVLGPIILHGFLFKIFHLTEWCPVFKV